MQSSKKSDRNWVFSEWPATSIVQYKVLNGNKDETSSIVRRRGRTVAKVSLFCKVHNQRSNWNSDIGSETVLINSDIGSAWSTQAFIFFLKVSSMWCSRRLKTICSSVSLWRNLLPGNFYPNCRQWQIDADYQLQDTNTKYFCGGFCFFFFVVVLIHIISNIPETSFSFKDCF